MNNDKPRVARSRLSISIMLALGMFVVFVTVFAVYVHTEKRIDQANELRQSSDVLTRMVRTYVATGNPIYKHRYQEILDI